MQVLYKLIDLGFAKDLSAESTMASFVGTEQYLVSFTATFVSIKSKNGQVGCEFEKKLNCSKHVIQKSLINADDHC